MKRLIPLLLLLQVGCVTFPKRGDSVLMETRFGIYQGPVDAVRSWILISEGNRLVIAGYNKRFTTGTSVMITRLTPDSEWLIAKNLDEYQQSYRCKKKRK